MGILFVIFDQVLPQNFWKFDRLVADWCFSCFSRRSRQVIMAVGKNKRLSKGKKGSKKKAYVLIFIYLVDGFRHVAMSEWGDLESCQVRLLAAEAGGTAGPRGRVLPAN
jgi:hypothetical protein